MPHSITELLTIFKESETLESRRGRIDSSGSLLAAENLEAILRLNVDFVSHRDQVPELRNLVAATPWEHDNLVHLQCTALVHELVCLGARLVRRHRLIFADLWLADHAQASDRQPMLWAAASCLDEVGLDKELLRKRFESYFKQEGTRLRERSYLSGYSPEQNPGATYLITKTVQLAEKVSFCIPAHSWEGSLGTGRATGKQEAYLESVVLHGQADGSQTQFYLEHLQAGFDASDKISEVAPECREACTLHLFLTFAPTDSSADGHTLADLHSTIGEQMARISTLFLVEKSRRLRMEVEEARRWESERRAQLTTQVEDLLKQLGAVEGIARGLRQSIDSPLERYKSWIDKSLPKLFDSNTGRLSNLRAEFGDLRTEHNDGLWTHEHLIAALWLLCEPPMPRWLGDALRDGVPLTEVWRLVIVNAEKRDAADPWYFCAAHYATIDEAKLESLAAVLKRIQRERDRRGLILHLDHGVLQFLTGVSITPAEGVPSESQAQIPSNVVIDIPKVWHESIFIGIPQLARNVKHLEAIQPDWSNGNTAIKLKWLVGHSDDPVSLVRHVDEFVRKVFTTLGRNELGLEASTSQRLERLRGKNDTSKAIARVLLPELTSDHSGYPAIKIEYTTNRLLVRWQQAERTEEIMVSRLTLDQTSIEPNVPTYFHLELFPSSIPSN